MIRRAVPWLFLSGAVLGLIAALTRNRVNWWYVGERFCHVLISLTY